MESEIPVKIFYAHYIGKPGGGEKEITLSGTGYLHIKTVQTAGEKPKVQETTISQEKVNSLLQVFEREGFFSLSDHYPNVDNVDDFGRMVLELTLPHRSKKVVVDQPGVTAVQTIAAAILEMVGS